MIIKQEEEKKINRRLSYLGNWIATEGNTERQIDEVEKRMKGLVEHGG